MIVRIEPLLHRESLHVALFALIAVSRSEILFENAQVELLVTSRNNIQQKCGVENVIVEREIVRRNEGNIGFALLFPTILTDFGGDLLEFRFGDFALEELFTCKLEFTILTDTRETNYRRLFIAHCI